MEKCTLGVKVPRRRAFWGSNSLGAEHFGGKSPLGRSKPVGKIPLSRVNNAELVRSIVPNISDSPQVQVKKKLRGSSKSHAQRANYLKQISGFFKSWLKIVDYIWSILSAFQYNDVKVSQNYQICVGNYPHRVVKVGVLCAWLLVHLLTRST